MSSDVQRTSTHTIRAAILVASAVALCIAAGAEFQDMWGPDDLRPSPELTRRGMLSDYWPPLKDTRADTPVFLFDGPAPGPAVLLLGGTHPNEPAGFMAAVVVLENAKVQTGRLIVLPQACASGFTCTDPLEGSPQVFTIPTPAGQRSFRFGSRGANVVDQWPDPLVYLHHPSGQQLSGNETRNLNRAYPGRPDGSWTEQVAYAIMRLIESEQVQVAVDLHEAAPEIPIINAIVAHDKGREIAGEAVLNLELEELQYALEISPARFRGLSHREWGDRTAAIPFLMETSNPIQGRLRGKTSVDLILEGHDPWYERAARLGTIRIVYSPGGESLSRRVGRHLQGFRAILEAFNGMQSGPPVLVQGIPSYAEVMERGVGGFLR